MQKHHNNCIDSKGLHFTTMQHPIRKANANKLLSPTRIGNPKVKTPKLFITGLNEPIRLTLDLREKSATVLSGM